MKHYTLIWLIILFGVGIFLGYEIGTKATFANYLDKVQEASKVVWKDGCEFVDITVGCECGTKLYFEAPYPSNLWPFAITCRECRTKYVMTREPVSLEVVGWIDYSNATPAQIKELMSGAI